MKFANPTARKEAKRCPQRYFYRYSYLPTSIEEQLAFSNRRQLYGIRELAGHLVHQTLASMVNVLADGDYSWSYASAGKQCLEQFTLVAAKSLALEPGLFEGGLQLAETFHGLPASEIADDLRFWMECIPTLIEHGFRAFHTLGIGQRTSVYTVEAERRFEKMGHGGLVMDILTQRKSEVICVDFKCHRIDNSDIFQIREYLAFLHRDQRIPVSHLHGFAVDLFREEIVRVIYDPYRTTGRPAPWAPASVSSVPAGPRPPKPHPDICIRCPYADLCPVADLPAGRRLAQIGRSTIFNPEQTCLPSHTGSPRILYSLASL
jgi:hypothetical protein